MTKLSDCCPRHGKASCGVIKTPCCEKCPNHDFWIKGKTTPKPDIEKDLKTLAKEAYETFSPEEIRRIRTEAHLEQGGEWPKGFVPLSVCCNAPFYFMNNGRKSYTIMWGNNAKAYCSNCRNEQYEYIDPPSDPVEKIEHDYKNNGLGAEICRRCKHIMTTPDWPPYCSGSVDSSVDNPSVSPSDRSSKPTDTQIAPSEEWGEIDILNMIRSKYGQLWQKDPSGKPTFEVTVEIASLISSLLSTSNEKARKEGYDKCLTELCANAKKAGLQGELIDIIFPKIKGEL